ncbi:MAG: TIGR01620 family protein [Pseudolabrys sp.]
MTPPIEERMGPRVIEEDAPADRGNEFTPGPAVFKTEVTERVVPAERALTTPPSAAPTKVRRRDRWIRLGLWGVGLSLAGWLGLDSYLWVSDAFARSATFGYIASGIVTVGVGGAVLIVARELRSFFALKSVEHNQARLEQASAQLGSAEMHEAIRQVLASVPKDRESEAAIEAYQRQAQAHHTPRQQVELLSRTVMRPLDRRAEAVVRRASARAFAMTAIAPTTLIDTVLFVALSVRMVRGIAASYGHRPTAASTLHLLRRLVFEAGKFGAVGLAGMALTQHLSGAVLERLAADSAESMYAAQRIARIGLITMGLSRPVPFQEGEAPGVFSSLIGNLFASNDKTDR